jgi:acetolactate synthase small subunit
MYTAIVVESSQSSDASKAPDVRMRRRGSVPDLSANKFLEQQSGVLRRVMAVFVQQGVLNVEQSGVFRGVMTVFVQQGVLNVEQSGVLRRVMAVFVQQGVLNVEQSGVLRRE